MATFTFDAYNRENFKFVECKYESANREQDSYLLLVPYIFCDATYTDAHRFVTLKRNLEK